MYEYAGGDRYEGQFIDDVREGWGSYTWAEGCKYAGEWKNAEMDGRGDRTYENGDRFVGDFAHNQAHGKGIKYFADGGRYEGEMSHDSLNGCGTYTWECRDEYHGQFRNDRPNGRGIMVVVSDGCTYDGTWHDGLQHGLCIVEEEDEDDMDGQVVQSLEYWRTGKFMRMEQANLNPNPRSRPLIHFPALN